jgi:hypothetical protein
MNEQTKAHFDRYHAALHAMQSGVAMEMEQPGNASASPKHLRVGVNAALCDGSGLAKLLMAKGLITLEEYAKAIADEMEAEKARYEQRLTERMSKMSPNPDGCKVSLA